MKHIPTRFERVFDGHKIVDILPNFTNNDCEKALKIGVPTVKYDGAACAYIRGYLYKRLNFGKAKQIPVNTEIIFCESKPDTVTGHWPVWVRCSRDKPQDVHFFAAYDNYFSSPQFLTDGASYEAIGPHFQKNPHCLPVDTLIEHGTVVAELPARTFEGVKEWLETHNEEGLVFWLNNRPVCKIKRSDFCLPWRGYGK